MKQVPLTRGYVALVDDADYERVKAAGPWCADLRPGGRVYAKRNVRRVDGRMTKQPLHRFILGLMNPRIQGDHRNHNGLDNRRVNLRTASNGQNQANARKRVGTSSKYKGVSRRKDCKKWEAYIVVNGKKKHLGDFDSEIDAACAYYRAACDHFGEFKTTSFLPGEKAPGHSR